MIKKVIISLMIVVLGFGAGYAQVDEKLLKLNPLVSERIVIRTNSVEEGRNRYALGLLGVGLTSLALAFNEQDKEAKLEYSALGAGGIVFFLTRNLFPEKMSILRQKIELAEPGIKREALAYNSLIKMAEDEKHIKPWICPMALVCASILIVQSNSYVTPIRYLLMGMGAMVGVAGVASCFVPTWAEEEINKVNGELKGITLESVTADKMHVAETSN